MCPVALTDTVSISYTAALESGEVIEDIPATDPITVAIGSGKVSMAVEASLLGMNPGETRTVLIQPEDAYGPYHKELVHEISRTAFSGKLEPEPGMILALSVEKNGKKEQIPATILAVNADLVKVDYNHPLAGKVLTYTVTLHSIAS